MDWLRQIWRFTTPWRARFALALLLPLLIPLRDAPPPDPQVEFDRAKQLFRDGYLEESQQEGDQGRQRYKKSDPGWAAKFSLLEAEDMLWRGMYGDALELLNAPGMALNNPEDSVERALIRALSLARLHRFAAATEQLAQADVVCAGSAYSACVGLSRTRGLMSMELGQLGSAREYFLQNLAFSRLHKDRWQEAVALLNLGFVSLQDNHFDEALDWSIAAHRQAMEIHAEEVAQASLGNLGWAYFELGDSDRSLDLFLQAERSSRKLGNLHTQLKWLGRAGYVERNRGSLVRAADHYGQALSIARTIDSRQDMIDILEDLSHISIDEGKIDEAGIYIDEAASLIHDSGNRLDQLEVLLVQGRIAAARREDKQAENLFETVRHDPAAQTSMRLGAGHELARLYELEGNTAAADRTYKATLAAFEAARSELKKEESKLPFLANATSIYDDYIHFLVREGRPEEALAAADRSRARTLAQGLGLAKIRPASNSPDPAALALRTGSTLLFYWLGQKQSYLWTITPGKITIFPLPAESVIAPVIDRYRHALEGPDDPLESNNEDGGSLYQMLVAPARALIRPGAQVVLLDDGPLSKLNFETLIVPVANPGGHLPHYWIEDVTLVSAPSLLMMANRRAAESRNRSLLMLGDAVSSDPEYPRLPNAAEEMRQIASHFRPGDQAVFSRASATPAVYLASAPERYGFIHFVTHAVASSADPLDSAILLSRNSASDDSFKLYARQILARPIRARLVTISACYGGGMRSYAGEGLVGLSWAFLRAGAHSVIGALWEASDETTPALMDSLYQGLGQGMTPAAALRNAKLGLLHSHTSLRKPYFWAPFQLYSGL
jgi:CHAT domain-containing protein